MLSIWPFAVLFLVGFHQVASLDKLVRLNAAPKFSKSIYSIDIVENAPGGLLETVSVSDDGDLTMLRFTLLDQFKGISLIVVPQNENCLIILAATVDAETLDSQYNFTIAAVDDQMMLSTATLLLNIIDVNEKPTLSKLEYEGTLTDDGATLVFKENIQAVDNDLSPKFNQIDGFKFLSGNEDGNFKLAEDGILKLERPVDIEKFKDSLTLRVYAVDNGTPRLASKVSTIVINIERLSATTLAPSSSHLTSPVPTTVVLTSRPMQTKVGMSTPVLPTMVPHSSTQRISPSRSLIAPSSTVVILPSVRPTVKNVREYTCPDWMVKYNDKCLKLVKGKKSWKSAQKYCKKLGEKINMKPGNLATIGDQDKQTFLVDNVMYQRRATWIGLSDMSSSGTWSWSDGGGTDAKFSKHGTMKGPKKQNQKKQSQQCVALGGQTQKALGIWGKFNCDRRQWSLCEFPAKVVKTVSEKEL